MQDYTEEHKDEESVGNSLLYVVAMLLLAFMAVMVYPAHKKDAEIVAKAAGDLQKISPAAGVISQPAQEEPQPQSAATDVALPTVPAAIEDNAGPLAEEEPATPAKN